MVRLLATPEHCLAQATAAREAAALATTPAERAKWLATAIGYDRLGERLARAEGHRAQPTAPLVPLPRLVPVEPPAPDALFVTVEEQEHLERAHQELCTALTAVRSNIELVRIELRRDDPAGGVMVVVTAHLAEMETAVDRLQRLARQMRDWHDGRA